EQVLAFGMEVVIDSIGRFANIYARDEARLGNKARTQILVVEKQTQAASVAIQSQVVSGAGLIRAACVARGTGDGLSVRHPVLIEFPTKVHAADAVESPSAIWPACGLRSAPEFAIGKHHANRRLILELAIRARHSE